MTKPSIVTRIKSRIFAAITGRFLPKAIVAVAAFVGTKVFDLLVVATVKYPALGAILTPENAQALAADVQKWTLIILGLWASHALGKPVRELQEDMLASGVPPERVGSPDGWAGPTFQPVLYQTINDPEIEVRRARLVAEEPDHDPYSPPRRKFVRPLGSNHKNQ